METSQFINKIVKKARRMQKHIDDEIKLCNMEMMRELEAFVAKNFLIKKHDLIKILRVNHCVADIKRDEVYIINAMMIKKVPVVTRSVKDATAICLQCVRVNDKEQYSFVNIPIAFSAVERYKGVRFIKMIHPKLKKRGLMAIEEVNTADADVITYEFQFDRKKYNPILAPRKRKSKKNVVITKKLK